MSHTEKELRFQEHYHGRIVDFKVHTVRLEDGTEAPREVVHHPGGVCVVAVDEKGRLLLVRQYRFAAGKELLELPAGKLERGEDPMEAAKRELEEETGYTTNSLTLVTAMVPTPGYCTEVIRIYLADKLLPGKQHLDEGEFLSVEAICFQQAVAMVLSGEIVDGKTQVGILMADALQRHQK